MISLWVPGPLPGMNELIAAAKSGRGKGNAYSRLKAEWTDAVIALANSSKLPPLKRSVVFRFTWVEKDRRRDPDNVAAGGRKLILDGLVAAGVLRGDGWRYVQSWTDHFYVWHEGLKGPGCGVEMHEMEGAVLMEPAGKE